MKQNKVSVEEMESRLEMGSWYAHEPGKDGPAYSFSLEDLF